MTVRQAGLNEKRARLNKVGEVNGGAAKALPPLDLMAAARAALATATGAKKEVLTAEQKQQKQENRQGVFVLREEARKSRKKY